MSISADTITRDSRPRTKERSRLITWLLLWVVLANIGFSLLWMVGSPPRYPDILATSIIGLLTRKTGAIMRTMAFIVMVLFSILQFISRLFDLSLATLASAFRFQTELQLNEAPAYVVAILVLGLVLIFGAFVARRDMAFRSHSSLIIAVAATSLIAGTDYAVVSQTRGSYAQSAPGDAKFESALQNSGFLRGVGSKRNLVLIIVEAMGVPRDPILLDRLFSSLKTASVTARYTVAQGGTLFYGSTTHAEIRELCGRWGNYDPLLERPDRGCLPFALRRQNYQTTAVHAFQPGFFDRARWYPNVGFQQMLFRGDLVARGAATCPSLFTGACDRDIPRIIAARLKAAKTPQFMYWLTLNSHFPVASLDAIHTTHCETIDAQLALQHPMACRMFKLWDEVFASLAHEITASDLPATDILIVGDHRPPFYDRDQREMFKTDQVPWILLRSRAGTKAGLKLPTR